ncbi:MAG: hypothetical protein U0401_17180 [Anaerolineae bacterium]
MELGIWLEGNEEARTLTIRDSGIGMTQAEMIENLGTIAHSAKDFLKALEAAGKKARCHRRCYYQFGVGFYSVFMVFTRKSPSPPVPISRKRKRPSGLQPDRALIALARLTKKSAAPPSPLNSRKKPKSLLAAIVCARLSKPTPTL